MCLIKFTSEKSKDLHISIFYTSMGLETTVINEYQVLKRALNINLKNKKYSLLSMFSGREFFSFLRIKQWKVTSTSLHCVQSLFCEVSICQ